PAAPSPAPRWLQGMQPDCLTFSRGLQVNQGNMPGIQSTFLAMDTEEGVEVVWNELLFTDKKAFKAHEEKIKTMFEQLVLVDHPNIVKLHKYWLDVKDSKARVIFITEYVSSGSLKQFLKKTKKNHKAMNARVGCALGGRTDPGAPCAAGTPVVLEGHPGAPRTPSEPALQPPSVEPTGTRSGEAAAAAKAEPSSQSWCPWSRCPWSQCPRWCTEFAHASMYRPCAQAS
uniref:Serine-threonine/tyrosine-protein kinase catalytic domain-containing protein n=1 Tax=Nothoprocta perdicaria TaxID=30464 RepID=A0A8C6ZE87_NOTPE